jgi:alpha-tubulin suppressor-like RCC1 family protein
MNSHLPIVALTALAACEGPFVPPPMGPPPPPAVASLRLTPDSSTIVAGDTLALTVTLRDSAGQVLVGRPVAWETADSFIATVTPAGIVLGVDAGHTSVRASANGHADSVIVFVTPIVYTSISAGATHACATANNQYAYCWGDNTHGQTGTGSGALEDPTPRAVASATRFSLVAAGGDHTCALTPGGEVWCWGRNDRGQLGRNLVGENGLAGPLATTLRFTALAAGSSHTCALATTGGAYCWGVDESGQLGDGSSGFSATPRAVTADTLFAAIAAGGSHTCALTATGAAYCWGSNAAGQLGDGYRLNGLSFKNTPVAVAGGLTFVQISAGGSHTCAVTAAGVAYCWGANTAGQLGTGAADSFALTPQRVTGSVNFHTITAGGPHICGLSTDSLAYCWGNNADGELGNGTTSSQPTATPVPVSGGPHFADLRAGASHTCAITGGAGLVIYCWGLGLQGQLGQAFPHSSAVPLRVTGQP